ncbi:BURP domain-containing protein BNM2A-like [Amaranthus tricolor]|uniref:BURP domain-containing protein BNM2A-like n=1 Tax=Amaranthus tricolor TaxID=29722 RepID=UPI00258DFBDA|nr:BURP domain-containing protein BNM2A-like [Amaranthus tricolor]
MYHKFVQWSLNLYYLFLLMSITIDATLQHDSNEGMAHSTMASLTKGHDDSIVVFFKPSDLKMGKVIPTIFQGRNQSSHFLPREKSELIPFSSSKLPYLLQLFGISQDSIRGEAMKTALNECETSPIHGETKTCATSLESMLDFVHEIFGKNIKFQALTTQNKGKSIVQKYRIVAKPTQIWAPKMVACHTIPYPYVVYYCHYHKSESKVFKVILMGENGDMVEAVVVCHMDTSQWSPDHSSFKELDTKPGQSPVCHFFPDDNLLWVPLRNGRGVFS